MGQVTTDDGITLEYETLGSPSDPPLVMIAGFGSQLVSWPREFCQLLADGGRYVVSFDNRDCGLSTKMDGQTPDMEAISAAAQAGNWGLARSLAPYTFSDLADDTFGLLDGLGIERAHLLGVSMGGMIAQTMAIERPQRVLSLISMMSTTGEPDVGRSEPEALAALMTPGPPDREGYIDSAKKVLIWRSKRYPELEEAREVAALSYDRCYYPESGLRNFAAIIASGSRADGLRQLAVPTLVIHGVEDTLITPYGGERTAELVPGAKLLMVEDMGHDRPKPLWPLLCEAILDHTA
jgi:pimeloyl-ACP methyl ester carboxylesterase